MIAAVVNAIAAGILDTIRQSGYAGIAILMALESACIPIPSEIIMTFSGYLVSLHLMTLTGITLVGTLGSVLGSLAAYAFGAYGGLPILERYGHYILISQHDLERAHKWFERHGEATVFIGRLLPILRTFISLPAGVARMPLAPFIAYSTVGSFIWCGALGFVGLRLGDHWRALGPYMHKIDEGIGIGIITFALIILRRQWRQREPIDHQDDQQ